MTKVTHGEENLVTEDQGGVFVMYTYFFEFCAKCKYYLFN